MMARLVPFVLGAIAATSFTIALFFLRFYRDSKDALFAWFSAAFAVLGLNRLLFAVSASPNEGEPLLYWMRAIAYSLILVGIYQKNRR